MKLNWRPRFGIAIAALSLLGACGGSDSIAVDLTDPLVRPFVGDWRATTFRVTSAANDTLAVEVLNNGSFTINVQPSGLYTATLLFLGTPLVEIGSMSVSGSSVTLTPRNGPAATSLYAFDGPDQVTLDGVTEFDFNLDGTAEAANAHIELSRAQG